MKEGIHPKYGASKITLLRPSAPGAHALLPWRTVMGNVAYAVSSRWRKWSREQVRAQAPDHASGPRGADDDPDPASRTGIG